MTEARAVLDACVLFPQYLKDFLLTQAEYGRFFAPFWSKTINDEWINNLILKKPQLDKNRLRQTERDMNLAFPEADCDDKAQLHKLDGIEFKDKNDKHVVATAIESKADFIFTFNLKDFPEKILTRFGIQAISPDTFFSELTTEENERMGRVLSMQLMKYQSPRITSKEFLQILRRSGMKNTCQIMEELFQISR